MTDLTYRPMLDLPNAIPERKKSVVDIIDIGRSKTKLKQGE